MNSFKFSNLNENIFNDDNFDKNDNENILCLDATLKIIIHIKVCLALGPIFRGQASQVASSDLPSQSAARERTNAILAGVWLMGRTPHPNPWHRNGKRKLEPLLKTPLSIIVRGLPPTATPP